MASNNNSTTTKDMEMKDITQDWGLVEPLDDTTKEPTGIALVAEEAPLAATAAPAAEPAAAPVAAPEKAPALLATAPTAAPVPAPKELLAKLSYGAATRLVSLRGANVTMHGVRDALEAVHGDAAAAGDLYVVLAGELRRLAADADVAALADGTAVKIVAVAKDDGAAGLAPLLEKATIDDTTLDDEGMDVFQHAAVAFKTKGLDVPADQVRRVCEVLEMRPLRLVAYELAPEAALAREPERGDAQLAYAGPVAEGAAALAFDGEGAEAEDPRVAALAARGVTLDGPTIRAVLEALDVGPQRFVRYGLVAGPPGGGKGQGRRRGRGDGPGGRCDGPGGGRCGPGKRHRGGGWPGKGGGGGGFRGGKGGWGGGRGGGKGGWGGRGGGGWGGWGGGRGGGWRGKGKGGGWEDDEDGPGYGGRGGGGWKRWAKSWGAFVTTPKTTEPKSTAE